MTTSAGATRLKTRQQLGSASDSLSKEGMLHKDTKAVPFISGEFIAKALDSARSQSPDEFRRQQQNWLSNQLTPLKTATEVLYESAARQRGIETADAALQGAMLGGETVRLAIQAEAITRAECLGNLATWEIGMRGIVYDQGIDDDQLGMFLRPDAVAAMLEVRSPVARTTATMVIGICCHAK